MAFAEISLDILMERVKIQAALAGERCVSRCLTLQVRRERLRARWAAARSEYLGARLALRSEGRELRRALEDLARDCRPQGGGEEAAASSEGSGGRLEDAPKRRRLSLRRARPSPRSPPLLSPRYPPSPPRGVTVAESQPVCAGEPRAGDDDDGHASDDLVEDTPRTA